MSIMSDDVAKQKYLKFTTPEGLRYSDGDSKYNVYQLVSLPEDTSNITRLELGLKDNSDKSDTPSQAIIIMEFAGQNLIYLNSEKTGNEMSGQFALGIYNNYLYIQFISELTSESDTDYCKFSINTVGIGYGLESIEYSYKKEDNIDQNNYGTEITKYNFKIFDFDKVYFGAPDNKEITFINNVKINSIEADTVTMHSTKASNIIVDGGIVKALGNVSAKSVTTDELNTAGITAQRIRFGPWEFNYTTDSMESASGTTSNVGVLTITRPE